MPARQLPQISAPRLAGLFKAGTGKALALLLEGEQLVVQSSLADETHEYLYANQAWPAGDLGFPQSGKFHLDATPGLNLQMAFLFLDDRKQRLGHKLCAAGRNETLALPDGTRFIQLALRVYGPGTAKITGLLLDHVPEVPDRLFGRADYLLLTNHYPSDADLYRNAFVHRRVLEYGKQNTKVDVFRLKAGEKLAYHEFDGVDVISGGAEALATLLTSNPYKAILVHFLDQRMWSALEPYAGKTRILIWVHGAEIQAWHRRGAHYGSSTQLEGAKVDSEKRSTFWRQVTKGLPDHAKLIFVSRHFAEEVITDLGVELAADRYEIIHNVIDTRLFGYKAKPPEQRKRVLSIRPHTSRIYGNDLAVAAVLELTKKPYFGDLSFHFVGDGPLFEETVAPLRGLPNVRLDKRFLTQREIAELHREYGVFLCPSRGDTQGVSRDEAMSSGLVPVTNRAGAISEFVDERSGMLADREDFVGLAAGIARLYEDPELFASLSVQAAARVRGQSGPAQTTERELQLVAGHLERHP
jgi:glycosyltransferase involved in cell wall biosynthesis